MKFDAGYKGIFGQRLVMIDFMRGFLDPELVETLDLRTLQPVPVGRVTEGLQRRENDLVWRVQRKGRRGQPGKWLYLYVMLEFQSTVDLLMPLRIMTYEGLLYEDLARSLNWDPSQKLPPVIAVVLYNGREPWRAKLDIAELIESVGPTLDPHIPKLRYELVDICRCPELEGRNLADATFRLDRSEGPAQAEAALGALSEAIRGPSSGSMRRIFLAYVREWLAERLPDEEFEGLKSLQEARTMVQKKTLVWSEQWREEGREEGRLEMLVGFVRERFGDAVAEKAHSALAAMSDPKALDRARAWLLGCESADAFLARLKSA